MTDSHQHSLEFRRDHDRAAFRYGSVCSGIEAATVAWHGLGWKPSFFSEIDKFPRAVLAAHYPKVPLHGDFTTIKAGEYDPIDLLVGGTPCQSFSVAGLRGGLADDRGNLALEYLRLAQRLRPRWLVWENVPGVLSSAGGRDFGSILGGMGELGYGVAYRVLDAQFFGVAQRRRRVFVVGYLGDWRRAAAVLFEPESLRGNPAPSREARKEVAGTIEASLGRSRGAGTPMHNIVQQPYTVANCLTQRMHKGINTTLDEGQTPIIEAIPIHDQATRFAGKRGDKQDGKGNGFGVGFPGEPAPTLTKGDKHAVAYSSAVRRLTPIECERLQGFADNYTNIPWRKAIDSPDGPRYKALGNSMAVPVMKWIGERIKLHMLTPAS